MIQEEENEASLADKFEADPLADLTVIMIRDPCQDPIEFYATEKYREIQWDIDNDEESTLEFKVEPFTFMPAEADCEPTFTCENSDGLCQLGNLDSVTGAFSL